jgi:hypothetical protein
VYASVRVSAEQDEWCRWKREGAQSDEAVVVNW